jgi:hypothetical protein
MKKSILVVVTLVLAGLAWAAPGVQAATKCTFYVVHGLPGLDIAKAADLPVDVAFNNVYVVKALKFGKTSAALKLDPGSYAVKVYEAGQGPTAAATPLIQTAVVLAENEQASVVLHLTKAGKATLTKFANDLSKIVGGSGRIVVHCLIAGADMGFYFLNNKYEGGHPLNLIDWLPAGNKCAMEVSPAWGTSYKLEVIESKPNAPTFLQKDFSVVANKVLLIYIVGTVRTSSLTVITKVLPAK